MTVCTCGFPLAISGSFWETRNKHICQQSGYSCTTFALIQLRCHQCQTKPSATLPRAVPSKCRLCAGLSFIPRPWGSFCFKISIPAIKCIVFFFHFQWQSGKKHSVSWRSGTGMWSVFIKFMCKTEPQDITCVIRQTPVACISNTSHVTLAARWEQCQSFSTPSSISLIPLEKYTNDFNLSDSAYASLSLSITPDRLGLDPLRSVSLWLMAYQSVMFYGWKDLKALLARLSLYVSKYGHEAQLGVK